MNSGFSLPHKALILGARYTAFDRGVRSRFFLLLLSQWVFYSGFSYWVEYNSFNLACVASVSEKVGTRAKKKERTGEGEGNEGTSSSPLTLPLPPFFFFAPAPNFRAVTRLETLATQATFNSTFCRVPNYLNVRLCRNYIMRRGHIRGSARINFFCP